MKKVFSLCLACLLAVLCATTAFASDIFGFTPDDPLVVDEADVLTPQEEADLAAYANRLASAYNYDIILYYADNMHDRDAQELADDYFDYNGYGRGAGKEGLILMVCPETGDYAFSGHGEAEAMFNYSRTNELEDSVLSYLYDEDWYGAGEAYFQLCGKDLERGLPEENSSGEDFSGVDFPEEGFPFFLIPFDLLAGFVLGLVPVSTMRSKLKSVAQQRTAGNYIAGNGNGIEITRSHDHFVNEIVTRRRIERERSSSSDNGHHVSSSGESHSGRSGNFKR